MAHRILFTFAGAEARVYRTHTAKPVTLHVQTHTMTSARLYDARFAYEYMIREWISPTECRATLIETQRRAH